MCAKRARRATARIAIGAEDKLNADGFESNEILPSIRETNPQVEREARPFSGRYDFLWFFRAPLATNRGRPITVSTLLRVCAVFGASIDRLVHGLDRGIYED